MAFLSLYILVIFVSVFSVEGRLIGRKLRNGEPCDTPGYFGDSDDCRVFYRCAEHPTEDENRPLLIKYTFRCPSGTAFDESLSTCNHADAVMNKPANCQVYDPEEPSTDTESGGSDGGQLLRQSVVLPINQLWYPFLTVPQVNHVPQTVIQYG